MFSFFSVEKQMRSNARNWLELSEKIFHYRRDELSTPDRAELQQKTEQLRGQLRERADASKLKLGIEALEPALRRCGGKFYPRSTVQEYVEFFVVAAIVILGLRAYFVQPFKIPTNSMWPTYFGMTAEVFPTQDTEPGAVARVARLLAYGATRRSVDAPADGDIWLPVGGQNGLIASAQVPGRTWFIFPALQQQITLRVGGQLAPFQVPVDFKFDKVAQEAFFPDSPDLATGLRRLISQGKFEDGVIPVGTSGRTMPVRWVNLGKSVRRGERVLAFDVLTGDQLFVERVSYHFVRPQVGSGFVFRTDNIDSEHMRDRMGNQVENYYIKRLVGTPGDRLEIVDGFLLRNNAPITGAKAFAKNNQREGLYRGYENKGELAKGQHVDVSPQGYYAMGDNSYESLDSRYWGEVPRKDVVGRPFFTYYPFTRRWGPTH